MNDDKEKSVFDRLKDTVSETVENMASGLTGTSQNKNGKKLAATTNEQVYIPDATDAAAMPPPLFGAPARKRKTRAKAKPSARPKKAAKKSESSAGRKTAAKKQPANKMKKRKAKP